MPKYCCPRAMKLLLIICITSTLALQTGAVNRCGRSYSAAAAKCSKCPKGIDSECGPGETCYASLPACTVKKPPAPHKHYPPPPHHSLSGYVALGDSYAAGIGNAESTYYPATAHTCKRSKSAWPELVRAGLKARGDTGATPFSFTACNGAKISDVYKQDQGHDLSATTKYVTISIGGNDLDFRGVILKCLKWTNVLRFKGSCVKYVKDKESEIPSLKPKLAKFYKDVKKLAPNARIFVVGYPHLLSNEFVVGIKKFGWHSINAGEVAALRNAVNKADDMIKKTCAENGVKFVDTRSAFDGHGCKGRDERINCVVKPGTKSQDQSFHPKTAGNKEYARLVLAAIG